MSWKFWKAEKEEGQAVAGNGEKKLHGPVDLPDTVGRHLVVKLHKDPDWVWNLKAVTRRREEGKSVFDVRVFDERSAREKQVKVRDYNSLNDHPEVILFEGWYDKKSQKAQIEEKTPPEATKAA